MYNHIIVCYPSQIGDNSFSHHRNTYLCHTGDDGAFKLVLNKHKTNDLNNWVIWSHVGRRNYRFDDSEDTVLLWQ